MVIVSGLWSSDSGFGLLVVVPVNLGAAVWSGGVVSESWNGSPVSGCSWPLLLDHGTAMLVSSLLVDVISES